MRARALAIRIATDIKLKRLEQLHCVQRMLYTAYLTTAASPCPIHGGHFLFAANHPPGIINSHHQMRAQTHPISLSQTPRTSSLHHYNSSSGGSY